MKSPKVPDKIFTSIKSLKPVSLVRLAWNHHCGTEDGSKFQRTPSLDPIFERFSIGVQDLAEETLVGSQLGRK